MSKSRPAPSFRLTWTDVRLVEVDFPRTLHSRPVIEFSQGLSLLLEDQAAIPLAAEFIATFRKHLAAKGGHFTIPKKFHSGTSLLFSTVSHLILGPL